MQIIKRKALFMLQKSWKDFLAYSIDANKELYNEFTHYTYANCDIVYGPLNFIIEYCQFKNVLSNNNNNNNSSDNNIGNSRNDFDISKSSNIVNIDIGDANVRLVAVCINQL